MAKALFTSTETQWFDDDGDPLAGGLIYFYEPGTTTLKNTYDEADLATANTNPVVLDANGRGVIWLNGEYKYKVTTAAGVDVGAVVDNLNTETASSVESGLLIANGSFEIDSEGLGQPDSWTIAPLAGATIAIDTTDSAHGLNSLKFLSGGAGGGTATSNRFDVLSDSIIQLSFTYKASSATVKTIVDIKTYDKNGGVLSTLNAYTDAAANPSTYETKTATILVDATAVTAELIITGLDAAGTITSGLTSHFDDFVFIRGQKLVTLDTGILILDTNTPPTVATAISHATLDPVNVSKAVVVGTVTLAGVTTDNITLALHVKNDNTVLNNAVYRKCATYGNTGIITGDSCEFTVSIDENNDFWYRCLWGGAGATTPTLELVLVGYYVD